MCKGNHDDSRLFPVPEIKWKYLVVIGAFLGRMVSQGGVFSLGVYYDDIKDSFNVSNTQTVVFFMVAYSLVDLSGIIASKLSKHFEERIIVMVGAVMATVGVISSAFTANFYLFIILLGAVNSIGEGVGRCLLPVAIGYSYDDHDRHKAMAIANVGDGVGGLVFPLIFAGTIKAYTWRSSLLIYAGAVFHLFLAGAMIEWKTKHEYRKRSQVSKASKASTVQKPMDLDSVTSLVLTPVCPISLWPNLFLLCGNLFLQGVAYSVFFTMIYSDMIQQSISPGTAAAIFGCVGGFSIPGRLLVSFMGNKLVPRWLVYCLLHLVKGAIVAFFPVVSDSHKVGVYVFLCSSFGFADGITGALIPITGLDLFGMERMADVYSYQLFAMGLGSICGLPVAGILQDKYNTFDIPLLLSSASFISAGLILVPCLWTRKYYQLLQNDNESK